MKIYHRKTTGFPNEQNLCLAQKIFPNAGWIWLRSCEHDERDRRVYFRRSFELDVVPGSTEIKITADSCYILWVNEKYVSRGPARGFQTNWPFDRIDIAPFLKKGKNVIAAMAYQYGISNYSYSHEFASGFLLAGNIERLNLGTGKDWKAKEASGYIRAVARASSQYCFQEFFDNRKIPENWQGINYDDSGWKNIGEGELRVVGAMPWHCFEERGIPLLTNDIIKPVKLISISKHKAASDWKIHQNQIKIYHQEKPKWEVVSEAVELINFKPDITGITIDFGKETVGTLKFDIDKAVDGEILDFMVCESASGVIPDFPKPDIISPTVFGGRIILKPGRNQHELTLPWGFRYLVLFRRDSSEIRVRASVRQTVYPLEVIGKFNSSCQLKNSIWNISEHAQRCCMVDAYIDCPWRENAQWWGDALVQAKNTFRLSNDSRLFERGLRQIGTQKTPNGLTYGVVPSRGHSCILPDYSAIWIITLYEHYWQTGSLSMWRKLLDTVDGVFNYFEKQLTDDGLLYYDKRYWLFLDWAPELHKNGAPTVLNLIYLWALQTALKMAEATKNGKRIRQYKNSIENLSSAIRKNLFNTETGMLYDGLTFTGKKVNKISPHAAALGIITDLLPEKHELWLNKILLPLLVGNRTERLLPSSYFMYYIFEAVKLKGYNKEVVDCILRWWKEFIDDGCSTTPENWVDKMQRGRWSRCHAWSAHPIVHFSEIILGVKQLTPGWTHVSFNPLMTNGEKTEGTVPTPYGSIKVKWDWTGIEPIKNIQLPKGIRLES